MKTWHGLYFVTIPLHLNSLESRNQTNTLFISSPPNLHLEQTDKEYNHEW